MATLIDERLEEEEEQQQDNDQQSEIINEEPVGQETQEEDYEEAIPDKYRGKSAEALVRMHQEAEKLLGRQS